MDKNSAYNMHDTYLRYLRYLTSPNFPESEKRKLIGGLVKIIQSCNNSATSPQEVYHLTEKFRKGSLPSCKED